MKIRIRQLDPVAMQALSVRGMERIGGDITWRPGRAADSETKMVSCFFHPICSTAERVQLMTVPFRIRHEDMRQTVLPEPLLFAHCSSSTSEKDRQGMEVATEFRDGYHIPINVLSISRQSGRGSVQDNKILRIFKADRSDSANGRPSSSGDARSSQRGDHGAPAQRSRRCAIKI